MRQHVRVTFGATLLASLALGACDRQGGVADDTVTLGTAGPWKEIYGRNNLRGIRLAVEHANAQRLLGDRKLVVIEKDDEGNGEKATQIATDFIENSAVVAVIGHVNSGAMMAAAKIYDRGLPAVATTASSPDLTGISPWVFRVISSDSVNGRDLARFASRLGRRRAAILYENNSYGRGLTQSFRRNFPGTIVGMDPIGESGDQNLEPYISMYKRLAPDIIFVAGTEQSGVAILREARRQGFAVDFIGGDGWTGVTFDTVASQGVYVAAPFTSTDRRPAAQKFTVAYRQKYGDEPDGNAALAYDATLLVVKAIVESGADREKVRAYLSKLTEATQFPGVTGPIRFGPDGDPLGKGLVMTRIRDGTLHVEGGGS